MASQRPGWRLRAAAALAGLAGLVGCVYTADVNQRPVVQSVSVAGASRTDSGVDLSIVVVDPDGDPVTVTGSVIGSTLRQTFAGTTVHFEPQMLGLSPGPGPFPFQVEVLAIDEPGARTTFSEIIMVENLAPVVRRIDVAAEPAALIDGSYAAQTQFDLLVARDPEAWDDDDPYGDDTLTWRLVAAPPGSGATVSACAPPGADHAADGCFQADGPGSYTVEVTVRDPHGAVGTLQKTLHVEPDRPPCLLGTLPGWSTPHLVYDVGTRARLSVTAVGDDLDPYPAGPVGVTSFAWSLRAHDCGSATGGAFTSVVGYPFATLLLEPVYSPGECLSVRVAALDRDASHAPACAEDQAECDYQSGCPAWVTWEIEYR